MKLIKQTAPPVFVFLLIAVIFEVLAANQFINETLFPAPSSVLQVLIEMRNDYLIAFKETFLNVLAGLALSVLIGSLIAITFSLSSFLKTAILPFAIFFQTVPIIAIAPLLVIYFGFGPPTVIACSFIVSIFPIIANTLIGLESTPPSLKDLFHIYRATKIQTLFKLKIPYSYSYIWSGIKIASGLSIIGAVAGEFVSGGGLGAIIDSARTQQRVDIVFGALLLLSLMGLLFISAWYIIQKIILSGRPYALTDRE